MRWEKGQHKPGPHYRQRMAEVTGQPAETFSDGDDDEEDDPVALLYRAVQAIVRDEGGAR
jgi:transcriptional regulator with XRE-family HTH domain